MEKCDHNTDISALEQFLSVKCSTTFCRGESLRISGVVTCYNHTVPTTTTLPPEKPEEGRNLLSVEHRKYVVPINSNSVYRMDSTAERRDTEINHLTAETKANENFLSDNKKL